MRFKKIASVLASAFMVGSTLFTGYATAAMYPQPFVSDSGVANVAIVYGSHTAATSDLVSVTAIQTDLSSYVLEDSVSGEATIEGGDFVRLDKSSTKFHLGNGITDVISSSVTNDDLPVLLTDGTYTDDDNDDFDYTQKLTLTNMSLTMFDDNDYKEDTPTVGFKISSGAQIMNYTLDFNTDPLWDDLDQTDIEIMGKNYFILSSTVNTTLNLLDAANTALVNEGETTSLVVGDTTYEISAQVYSATQTILTINGERTNSLNVGETQKLKGTTTYVGIKNIFYVSKESGISSVEFAVGSGKLELTDGQDVQINDDSINGLTVDFTNSQEKLQKIVLTWSADDDMFVTDDSSITMPGFENIKMSFTGMTFPAEETFTVQGGSTSYVQLNDFPTKESTEDIDLLYGSSSAFTGIGKDSDKILRTTNESSFTFTDSTDDYFIASYDDGSTAESYLVKATGFSSENSGANNRTTIQYKKDGAWVDKKEDAENGDTVNLGDVSLTIGTVNYASKTVVITAGNANVNFNRLYSKEGLKVWLPWLAAANNSQIAAYGPGALNLTSNLAGHNSTTFHLAFYEEDKNENIGSGNNFNVTLGWNSDSEAQVSDLVGESVSAAEVGDSNIFRTFMYSPLATEFMWDQGSGTSDQDSIEITYHGEESYANAFITDVGAKVGGSDGSNAIGVPLKDTEIASASGKNIIVVGGSCVNTVAAELLGGTDRFCGAEWTTATTLGENQFLIKTFSRTGGKVATLVAGWSAVDTQNAATALTTQDVDTTAGMAYTGSSADSITSM